MYQFEKLDQFVKSRIRLVLHIPVLIRLTRGEQQGRAVKRKKETERKKKKEETSQWRIDRWMNYEPNSSRAQCNLWAPDSSGYPPFSGDNLSFTFPSPVIIKQANQFWMA